MKSIVITLQPKGTASITRSEMYETENRATVLAVDYSLIAYLDSYLKYVDFKRSDGSTLTLPAIGDATVDQIQTMDITDALTVEGDLWMQPFAVKTVDDEIVKVMFQPVRFYVRESIKSTNDALAHPDEFVILQEDVAQLELDMDALELSVSELDQTVTDFLAVKYDDMVFEMTPGRQGANNKPDYDFTNIGFLFPQNLTTEIVYITAQLTHRWKEGTTIYPHVHVRQSANQQAVFKMDYQWYNVGDTIPSGWTTYTMDEYAIPYTSGNIAQIVKKSTGIAGTGKLISSILKIKLYRSDNVYTGDMLVDQFDIHVEIDSMGSETQYDKE